MDRDVFYLKVARALSGCQLVEQELKLYITEAFDLVRKKLEGEMPFKFAGEQYEDSALERLIDTFGKLSDNQELVTALRKFKDGRNYLSHRAITWCLDPEGELDFGAVATVEAKLKDIDLEAERLRMAISEEGRRVRINLWFDKIPPE